MTFIVVKPTGDTVEVPSGPVDVPPAPQVEASYLVTLEGVDGSVWDLNSGPVRLLPGVKLFNTGQVNHWWRSSPNIDGARHTGMKTPLKTLSLPISTNGDTWDEWRDNDTAFFQAIAPEGEARIVVTAPDAVSRSMKVRFESDGDVEDDIDPLLMCRKQYVLEMSGQSPFWSGEPITKTFEVSDPQPWLEPSGFIYLNPPTTIATASMPNPGDVEAWWEATVIAPFASFVVGVGDSVVSSTQPFASGRSVSVYSHPRRRIILDDAGNRINALMDKVAFEPIPRGEEVPMTLVVTGYGPETDVIVTLIPQYRRPI